MNSFKKIAWILLLNTFPLFYCLSQEVIILKNNNTLTGKISEYQQDTVVLKSEYGDLRIPRSDILRIEFSNPDKPNEEIKKSNQENETKKTLPPEPATKTSQGNSVNEIKSDNTDAVIITQKDLKKIKTASVLEGASFMYYAAVSIFGGLSCNENSKTISGILRNDLYSIEETTDNHKRYYNITSYGFCGSVVGLLISDTYNHFAINRNKENKQLKYYKSKLRNVPADITLCGGVTFAAIGVIINLKANKIFHPDDDYPDHMVSTDELNQADKKFNQAKDFYFVSSACFAAYGILRFIEKPYSKKKIDGFQIESLGPQFYPSSNSLCFALKIRL